jgi:hypothetical protein
MDIPYHLIIGRPCPENVVDEHPSYVAFKWPFTRPAEIRARDLTKGVSKGLLKNWKPKHMALLKSAFF